MSLNALTSGSGIDWAAYRMAIMRKPIKVGETIPDVRLSRLAPDGKTVEYFSTKNELSQKFVALFSSPKAFVPISSNEHFPGLIKAADAFNAMNIKMFCLSVNTRDELFAWEKDHCSDFRVKMIPDFDGDFTFYTGLGVNKSGWRHLGFVARPAALFLHNGKVLDVQIEEDFGKCTSISSAQGLLARIPSILNANDLTCEVEDFQLIETKDSDTAYLLQLLKNADQILNKHPYLPKK